MCARLWNGVSASTAMPSLVPDSPRRPHPFFCRYLCSPNVIAGRSERSSTRGRGWRGRRGDASSVGVGNVVDVHTRQQRGSAGCLEQKPRDCRRAWRRPNQLQLLARCTCFMCASEISRPPCNTQSASRRWPQAWKIGQPSPWGAAFWVIHSLAGDLDGARRQLEAALDRDYHERTNDRYSFKIRSMQDKALAAPIFALGSSAAKSALARTRSGRQGHPVQAVQRVHQTVGDAAPTDHPVTLLVAMSWGITVLLWAGELAAAQKYTDRFTSHVESYSLGPSYAVARGFKGELAIRQGDAKSGVESLLDCLKELRAARHLLMVTTFSISLAQGLAEIDRPAEGMAVVDGTIQSVAASGDHCYMPELLRLKGRLLRSMRRSNDDDAEMCFRESLKLSRRQGARAWELRTAIDLFELLSSKGRIAHARSLLQPVFETFAADSDTGDVRVAERLLAASVQTC